MVVAPKTPAGYGMKYIRMKRINRPPASARWVPRAPSSAPRASCRRRRRAWSGVFRA